MKFSQWFSLLALLAAGILLWTLRDILIIVFAGIVLAVTLCTLVKNVRSKIRLPRLIALFSCLLGLLIFLGIVLAVIVPPFTKELQQILLQLPYAANELWNLITVGIDQISDLIYGDDPKNIWGQKPYSNILSPLPDSSIIASGLTEGIQKLLGLAGDLGNAIIRILFVFAVTIMISIQPNSYLEVSIMLVPSFYRRRARYILKECGNAISSWMVGVLISSACVAIMAGIGLSFLGIKHVMANALLAGLLNFIPNVGPTISTLFPISVALLDEPWKVLAVIGLYLIIQNIESYLITPSIMHQKVKLLPGLTLTAQFIFTVIFGPIGLLLALPLAVSLQVLLREMVIHDLLDPWKKQRLIK